MGKVIYFLIKYTCTNNSQISFFFFFQTSACQAKEEMPRLNLYRILDFNLCYLPEGKPLSAPSADVNLSAGGPRRS